ncbi:MAG: hypothetical protein V2A71_04480 [Candidatus Eisenbacteria bacterium]
MNKEEAFLQALEKHELLDCLEGVVWQACGIGGSGDAPEYRLDSAAIRTYADALHLLARLGRVRITSDVGTWVVAVPVKRS